MEKNVDLIQQAMQLLVTAHAPLPKARLLPGDRQHLGGLLLPIGPALVGLVAEALSSDAEACAALPVSGEELRARQDEADGWRRLRAALLVCAEQAADQYVLCQSDATETAQAILARVQGEKGPAGAPERELRYRRKRALYSAGLCLASYRRKLAPPRKPRRPPSSLVKRRRAAAVLERAFLGHLHRMNVALAAKKSREALGTPAPRAEELLKQGAAQKPPRSPLMDIRDRFIAEVTGKQKGGALSPVLPTAELKKEQQRIADLFAECPAPEFQDDERKRLQSGLVLWAQALALGAEGLRARPDFAAARGITPEVCDLTIAQDSAVAKVVKGAGDLHESAKTIAGQTAREGRGRAIKVLQAAIGVVNDGADPTAATQASLEFSEAFRYYEEGTAGNGAALRLKKRLAPLREARDAARAETEQLRLINRFLAEGESTRKRGDHE